LIRKAGYRGGLQSFTISRERKEKKKVFDKMEKGSGLF